MFSQPEGKAKLSKLPLESEKSNKLQWANMKEETLLVKQVNILERSKRVVVNTIKMEQKMLYRRFENKINQSRLAYAKLVGNREDQKDLFRNKRHPAFNTDICKSEETGDVLKSIWETGSERAELLNNMTTRRRGLSISRSKSAGVEGLRRGWSSHASHNVVLPVHEYYSVKPDHIRPATAALLVSAPRVEVDSPRTPDVFNSVDPVLNIRGVKSLTPGRTSTKSSVSIVSDLNDDVNDDCRPDFNDRNYYILSNDLSSSKVDISVNNYTKNKLKKDSKRWNLTENDEDEAPVPRPRLSLTSSQRNSVSFTDDRIKSSIRTTILPKRCNTAQSSQSSISSSVAEQARSARYSRKKSSKISFSSEVSKLSYFHRTPVYSAKDYDAKVKQFVDDVKDLKTEQNNVSDYYSERAKENGIKRNEDATVSKQRQYAEEMLGLSSTRSNISQECKPNTQRTLAST